MDVKTKAPFDIIQAISWICQPIIKDPISHQPEDGSDHKSCQIKVNHHHVDYQFYYIPKSRCVSKTPGNGTDGKKSR
jgi:hypothetical protein